MEKRMANIKPTASSRARLLFEPTELHYNFGPDHPLQPSRIEALIDLLKETNMWHYENEQTRLPLRSATIEELQLVHTAEYVQAVQRLSLPEEPSMTKEERDERAGLALKYGFGDGDTPALPGMHEVTANIAGGTLIALSAVMGLLEGGTFATEEERPLHGRGATPARISSLRWSAPCLGRTRLWLLRV